MPDRVQKKVEYNLSNYHCWRNEWNSVLEQMKKNLSDKAELLEVIKTLRDIHSSQTEIEPYNKKLQECIDYSNEL